MAQRTRSDVNKKRTGTQKVLNALADFCSFMAGVRVDRLSAAGQVGRGYNYPMQYRLRTLLIVLALGPMVLAGTWWIGRAIVEFAPQPRSSAEAFTCFLICGLLLFALGGVFVERYRRQSQMRKAPG